MVSKRRRPIVDEEGRTREEFYADMVRTKKTISPNKTKISRNAIGGYVQKLEIGGEASWRNVQAQLRGGRGRPSKKTTTVGEAVDKVSSKEYNNRKGRFKSDFPFIIRGLNRANFSTGGNSGSSPSIANGFVYIKGNDGNLYQLNASTLALVNILKSNF
jgi:hypothetical protein